MEELIIQSQAFDDTRRDAEEKCGFMMSKPLRRDVTDNFRLSWKKKMSRVRVVVSSISKTKVNYHRQIAHDLSCAIRSEMWLLIEARGHYRRSFTVIGASEGVILTKS